MIGPSPPVHPGEILRLEFMAPLALSGYALAAPPVGSPAPGSSVWPERKRP
jgi:hypothetical protein